MPRSKTRLIRYRERLPLFSRYHLEPQIERIYDRSVPLKGGGSIVIDGTEALTAIDVNSGRTSGHGDHDETLLTVNLEAADEVARQLRQRDIGGLVVVDFIDMRPRKHQRKLEKTLRDALKVDKARTTVSRISANGLIEINRQRIKQALRTRSHRPCVACNGIGSVPTQEFAALGLMRRIEARAATGLIEGITLALHSEIADALQNNHRRELAQLEHEFDLKIDILASPNMSRIEQRIEWTKREGSNGAAVHSRAPVLTAIDLATPGLDERRPQRHGDLERAGDEADGSGRRRRRRRRRGPGDRYEHGDGHGDGHSDEHGDGHSDGHSDEAPDEALRTAVAEDSDGTEEAATAEDEDSRGRRRRRGGRRRRRAEPRASEETATREAATREAVAANGEDEVTTPVEPASEAATEGDEVSRPKRRRRPARRRRRPTDGAPAEDLDTGHEVAAADADAASQRRPRSRRRPRSGEDSEEVATASSGVRNADISAADDEPRSRPRRRSSRDRRLADGNNPNSRDEATAAAAETATAVAAAATTAASAEAAADDCGERPSRRRRSTRQSRPAGDSGKVATDDDSSTGAAAAGAPNAQRFAEGDATHLPFRPRYRSKDTSDAGNDRLPSEPRYRANAASDADNDRQRPEPQQQVEVKPVTSLRDAEAEAWNWLRPPAREEV